uniref:Glycosyltransferase n=1 Tax=Erysipelothrix rhusiopathiae TaxID=1648 RepID=A0A4V0P1A3_ERYRH|nr:glycosyltransferase [Erysipelothrix rhusiopathiae]
MRVLFISLTSLESFEQEGIYSDLLREFISNSHDVTAITPDSQLNKNFKKIRSLDNEIIKIKVPQVSGIQSKILKGINTILFPHILWRQMIKTIDVKEFDLVIYPTPPISIEKIIKKIKKKNKNIHTFLLLKDIFPQNAVDLKYFAENSLVHKYFRKQEIRLYKLSDSIGCMSPANKDYLIEHNSFLAKRKVSLVPNSISNHRINSKLNIEKKNKRKEKMGLPSNKKIIAYAGNLGKPQSIDFLIKNLENIDTNNSNVHFVFCGDGTEFMKLKKYCDSNSDLCSFFGKMSKQDSDALIAISDYGLILLDSRFTIPNYPSRMLSYMKFGLPLIAFTDSNTDIKDYIQEKNIGIWRESCDLNLSEVIPFIENIDNKTYNIFSNNASECLKNDFNTMDGYCTILNSFISRKGSE